MSPGIPKATHAGTMAIGNETLSCAVLQDGRRVFTQRGFLETIGRSKAKGGLPTGADNLPPFLNAKNLQPYVEKHVTVPTSPVPFRPLTGGRAYGYLAELLPEVCNVFLAARDDGALLPSQTHIAAQCDVLVRGLARVGIIALIDEATGFQKDRDRQELLRILEAYITPELLPWTKRFPDEFYSELFRLMEWEYPKPGGKRSGYVGYLTNVLIYEKLPPGVLDELRRVNPIVKPGRRRAKHHQFLTEDVGDPHLERQILMVITLMKAAPNRAAFFKMFQRVFPGEFIQLEFEFPDDEAAFGKDRE